MIGVALLFPLIFSKYTAPLKVGVIVALGLLAVGILLSGTRTAIILALTLPVFAALVTRRVLAALILMTVVAIALLLDPTETAPRWVTVLVEERFATTRVALFGVGGRFSEDAEAIRFVYDQGAISWGLGFGIIRHLSDSGQMSFPHNLLVWSFANGGLILMFVQGLVLIRLIQNGFRLSRDAHGHVSAFGLQILLLGMVFFGISMFWVYVTGGQIHPVFWIYLALSDHELSKRKLVTPSTAPEALGTQAPSAFRNLR